MAASSANSGESESWTPIDRLVVWSLAGLAALFLIWPVWRMALPLEIWGNEGWNAYHADAAMRGSGLYPRPDGLVADNYPPLSFYLIGGLARVFGDALYVGRALSLLATVALGLAAAVVARQFGGSRVAAAVAGLWFVATMARFFEFYVGMNEPQLLAQAIMAAGFVWFLARHAAGRAVEPAVLLMVLAGFFKHNIIALPLVALVWLTIENWRLGLRATLVGAVAAGAGLMLCAWLFAPYFLADLMTPRTYRLARAVSTLGRLQSSLPAMALWAIWAWSERHTARARFTALLIGVALVSCLIQKSAAGVDENAQFEFILATGIGVGLAFDGLVRDPLRTGWPRDRIKLVVLGILVARLLVSSRLEFAYVLLSPQYRALAAEHAAVARAEARRVAAIPGLVACSNLVVCRMAGKPFVFDHFRTMMMLETGVTTWPKLQALLDEKGIRMDNIDPRAQVQSIWRRIRSDGTWPKF